jgi:hypothetical protein
MRPLTIWLSRLIGLFMLLICVAMILHRRAMAETASLVVQDRPLLFFTAVLGLLAGLAMVLSHNIWSGGILPVVITLFGWVTLIRAIILLWAPSEALVSLFEKIDFAKFFYVPASIFLVLGLYLTYMGFRLPRP